MREAGNGGRGRPDGHLALDGAHGEELPLLLSRRRGGGEGPDGGRPGGESADDPHAGQGVEVPRADGEVGPGCRRVHQARPRAQGEVGDGRGVVSAEGGRGGQGDACEGEEEVKSLERTVLPFFLLPFHSLMRVDRCAESVMTSSPPVTSAVKQLMGSSSGMGARPSSTSSPPPSNSILQNGSKFCINVCPTSTAEVSTK